MEYTVSDQEQRQERYFYSGNYTDLIDHCSFPTFKYLFKSIFRIQSLYDVGGLKELFNKARFARCRARFVVPVILYEGKVYDHFC